MRPVIITIHYILFTFRFKRFFEKYVHLMKAIVFHGCFCFEFIKLCMDTSSLEVVIILKSIIYMITTDNTFVKE